MVEKKKPSQIQATAMQGFTTPGTSELVSMSFLCLDELVVDINTYQHRYAPLAAKKRKQQQSPYIILSSVSESRVKCFTINKKTQEAPVICNIELIRTLPHRPKYKCQTERMNKKP